MKKLPLSKAFTLLEPGPVVMITTHDGQHSNIMTIFWTMVVDFTPVFAITTGPWNHSFAALRKTKECVIAIPTVDLLDKVVGIGTCTGADTDKFAKFKLTPLKASKVKAPLIQECLANIECRVIDYNRKHGVVFLQGVAAWVDTTRKTDKERRMLHAVGDGTFIADGRKLDRRKAMRSKLPVGVWPSHQAARPAGSRPRRELVMRAASPRLGLDQHASFQQVADVPQGRVG